SSAPPAGRHQLPLSTRRVKRTAPSSPTRKTIAPGIRTRSEPTFCRRRHRYEPSNGILNPSASADLEDAGALVGEEQLDRARGRGLEGLGQIGRLGEAQV